MSIVKRKNAKGGVYYFNTVTKKFASESSYKSTKSAPMAKYKARKGKPSQANCSRSGYVLKVKNTSAAGRSLRACR